MVPSDWKQDHVAFVLGLFDTGLMAVRSLGRAGIRVIGVDADPRMPGFKSRYCAARQCPDPVAQPDALVDFLCTEARAAGRRGMLFPASDAHVLFVSRKREALSAYFDFALPPADVVEAILNKRAQYELAVRAGIPNPQTFFPETRQNVESIRNRISYPAFVKPCYTHLWKQHFDTKGFRVDSAAALAEQMERVLSAGLQVMVQSVIPGPCTNNFEISFYIGADGEMLAFVTIRKLRQYPPEFGVGTLIESIDCPELVTLALRLLDGLHYRGFGNLEFKLDPRDGVLKMIELNARLWQQNDQPAACGLNFPLIQYLDLSGQPPVKQKTIPVGVKWVDPLADFQSFWHYFRRGELSPGRWLQSWKGTRAFAVFARDDMLPAFASLDYGLKLLRMPLYVLKHRAD